MNLLERALGVLRGDNKGVEILPNLPPELKELLRNGELDDFFVIKGKINEELLKLGRTKLSPRDSRDAFDFLEEIEIRRSGRINTRV